MSTVDLAPASARGVEGEPRRPGSARALLRLYGSELRLIVSRRRNQVGVAVLALIPVVIALAVWYSAPEPGDGPNFMADTTSNGIFVALTALTVEITLFLPFAVAVLCGDAIAGEAGGGTLRYVLTVPVGRTKLLLVKYASVVTGAFVAVGVVAGTGVVFGAALFGLGPVTLLSGTQVALGDGLLRLLAVCAYLGCGLAALSAIGLFVSTLTEQAIATVIAVTVITTAMWVLDSLPQTAALQPYLLVHEWMSFADLLRDPVFLDGLQRGLVTALAHAVVFVGLAWWRFLRKDVVS